MIAETQRLTAARWDDVRLFLALYRERTLAGAGAAVGLDASTLSRRLATLEELLETRLFDRGRDGLEPTEGAELLLPAAEEMAQAHARFVQSVLGFERSVEGIVRLSAPPGLAETFVVPALVELRMKYPALRVELDASIRFTELTRREADLALRTRRPSAGDLVSVKLSERRWEPMLRAERARSVEPIGDWGKVSWIGWGDDMQEFPPARWVAKHVPRTALVLTTSHVAAQLAAVEAGLGLALLPPVYARRAGLRAARHAPALAASVAELPGTETWLVGHRALRRVPRIAAVWDFLVEQFARFEVQHARDKRRRP
jgi:DNA-binding transcriptional LysR family regulator